MNLCYIISYIYVSYINSNLFINRFSLKNRFYLRKRMNYINDLYSCSVCDIKFIEDKLRQ